MEMGVPMVQGKTDVKRMVNRTGIIGSSNN